MKKLRRRQGAVSSSVLLRRRDRGVGSIENETGAVKETGRHPLR